MDFLLHPKQPGSTPQTLRSHIFFTNLHFRRFKKKTGGESHSRVLYRFTDSVRQEPSDAAELPA